MKKTILFLLLVALTTPNLSAETVTLTGTLRDFNQNHVDFEAHMDWENGRYDKDKFYDGIKGGLELGNVKKILGQDSKPVINPYSKNNFKPKKLEQWYNDVDGVNMSMPLDIELTKLPNGLYQTKDFKGKFFPADGKLFGKEIYHGQTSKELQHNFHMTYELHTDFIYKRGQTFEFSGDDDVWVFIDKKLVIDLGGVHSEIDAKVNLDNLNLKEGATYQLDFFWAERHTTASNFTITTSIKFEDEEPPKPFVCESTGTVISYVTSGSAQRGSSNLKSINLLDGTPNSDITLDSPTIGVNSIGYNIKDDYVWGYNIPTRKVIRIDANNNVKYYEMDRVPDIGGHYYNTADVSPKGVLYLKSDTRPKRLDRVKLKDERTLHVLESITLDKEIYTADFAFNPLDGKIYYVDYMDGELKRIDIVGTKGKIKKVSKLEKVYTVIATFDKFGNFYYNNGEHINRVTFKNNGKIKEVIKDFSKISGITQGDGARCTNAGVIVEPPVIKSAQFDAWDIDESINKKVIKTKIVGDDIKLTLASLNKDGTEFKKTHIKSLKVALFSQEEQLTIWTSLALETATNMPITFTPDMFAHFNHTNEAFKDVKVVIEYEKDGETKRVFASDHFALRPDKFKLTLPTKVKSGEAFELKMQALNLNNKPTKLYDEAMNNSFIVNYKEKLAICNTGTINFKGVKFTNGLSTNNINYSEVGELDFNISELSGSEFAKIDASDTSALQRFITPASGISIEFTAGYFGIADLTIKHGMKDFTYYANQSDIDKMGAELNTTIIAYNMADEKLTNYKSGCYAKDATLKLKYNTDSKSAQTLNWESKNKIKTGAGTHDNLTINISSTEFMAGTITPTIRVNFGREKSKTKEPLSWKMTDINVTDTDGISGIKVVNKKADFYYGRLHTPNYYGAGSDHNITVNHEVYCKDASKAKFQYAAGKESEDNINWYVLKKPQYSNGGGFTNLKGINDKFVDRSTLDAATILSRSKNMLKTNGIDFTEISVSRAPFKDRITYKPSNWLIYNSFNAAADTDSFNINISSSSDWSGKGSEGLKIGGKASIQARQKISW